MKLRNINRVNAISKKFFIPILIFALIWFVGFGTLLVNKHHATFQFLMESKGKAMADFLEQISIKSIMNNDIPTLEDYVRETLKDPDVAFVAFYGPEKQPLTEKSKEPNNTTSLLIQEREIRSPMENGKSLGYLRLGYNLAPLSANLRSGILAMISTLVVLILLCLGVMALTRKPPLPVGPLTGAIEKVTQGDLTIQIESALGQGGDDVGILVHAFTKMSNFLKAVIKKIQEASRQITFFTEQGLAGAKNISEGAIHQADTAAKASSSVDEMNLSIHKIAEDIGGLSSSAQDNSYSLEEMGDAIKQAADSTAALSTAVEDTASSLLNMSGIIKEVTGYIDTLLLYAEEATSSVTEMNVSIEEVEKNAKESALLTEKFSQEAAELGIGAIEQTIDGMKQIKKTVEKSSHIIHKLDERAKKIGNILTVIDGVTRQTNLLALNAAILAAQAGNEGKGFAVVSEEMKNLADRTEASTTEIDQLIRDVQSDTTDAVVSVKEGLESVEEGVRRSDHARESLYKIMEISKRSSVMSRHIEKATVDQVKATNQMTQLMEKVSVMVMKINTAMNELECGTSKITQASGKMNSITEKVQTALEKQAKGGQHISDTEERMRVQIQQIATAVNEQKKGVEIIINSISEIRKTTEASIHTAQQMNQAMEGLTDQMNLLKRDVHHFKT